MEMVLRYEYAPAVFDGEFDHTEVQNKYCPSCRDIANPRLFLRACTQPQRGWMVHHPPPNSEIICLPPHLRMAAKDEPRDGWQSGVAELKRGEFTNPYKEDCHNGVL